MVAAWDLASGRLAWQSPRDAGDPWSLAVSPDGAWLIVGQMGVSPVRLYDTEKSGPPRLLGGAGAMVEAVAFDPAGRQAAWGRADGVVILGRLADQQPAWRVQAIPDWVESVNFLARGKEILVGSRARGLVVLDARTGKELRAAAVPGGVDHLAVIPGADIVLVCTYDLTLRSFRLPGLEEAGSAPLHHAGPQVRSMAATLDGALLATADSQGVVVIHDPRSLRPLFVMPASTRWIQQIAFDPTSRLLAFGGNDTDVSIWDLGLIRDELELLGLGLGPPSPPGAGLAGEGLRPTESRTIGPPIGEATELDRARRALTDRLNEVTARLEAGDRAGYRRVCALR